MTIDTPFAVEVAHLTVSYNARPALLDVSVNIEKARLVGVIGPNGAGKSTFIKAVLGFVKPDLGTVRIQGTDAKFAKGLVAYVPPAGGRGLGFSHHRQGGCPYGALPEDSLAYVSEAKDWDRAMEALEMVRMGDLAHRQIGELSGGQQQRVFMARALAQGSDILLLDEPFAGVDAATERAILDVLERAKQSGKTLVVVHHDLSTAAEYFDKLLLIKQRLYAYGPPDAVLQEDLLSQVYEGRLRIFKDVVKKEGN